MAKDADRSQPETVTGQDKQDEILVCHGFNCSSKYSELIKAKLQRRLADKDIEVDICACLGNCHNGNNLMINHKLLEGQSPKSVVRAAQRELSIQRRDQQGPISLQQADEILNIN